MEQRFHSRSCASRARERVRVRTQLNTTLTPRSRAALAAALDGEGWVSRNAWVIELGNTSLPWLRRLRAIAGGAGSIREDRGRTRPAHWKRFWRWRVYGQSAYALLLACLPELTVKRVRADAFVRSYRARADA